MPARGARGERLLGIARLLLVVPCASLGALDQPGRDAHIRGNAEGLVLAMPSESPQVAAPGRSPSRTRASLSSAGGGPRLQVVHLRSVDRDQVLSDTRIAVNARLCRTIDVFAKANVSRVGPSTDLLVVLSTSIVVAAETCALVPREASRVGCKHARTRTKAVVSLPPALGLSVVVPCESELVLSETPASRGREQRARLCPVLGTEETVGYPAPSSCSMKASTSGSAGSTR
jgi:hypothetical protein